jgi:tRNA A-37 threonylcarbamoyl transferase component Bud32
LIKFACACGKSLKVADELAGKKVKCPGCGKIVVAPGLVGAGAVNQTTAAPPSVDSQPPLGDTASIPAANAQEEATIAPTGSTPGQDTGTFDGVAGNEAQGTSEPRSLGGYRILRKLGHGGMGTVYEAEDVKLERRVALKVMMPQIARNPQHRERFLREARTAAKVESDFICPIYQVGEEGGVPFIAMPLLKGESLHERLQQDMRLENDEVVRIGKEVAEGLNAAHEAGLIHRDIKPANIWLETQRSGSPRARILDFGLARAQADHVQITQSGGIVGTPAYMSPEQARGDKNVDARTDLFSLGCVLYVLATGAMPFKGETTMAVLTALATQDPTPPHVIAPTIPKPLSKLIMRLLAKAPGERPTTAKDVIAELARIDTGLAEMPQGTPTKRTKPATRAPAKSAATTGQMPNGAANPAAKTQEMPPAAAPDGQRRKASYAFFALAAVGLLGCVLTVAGGGIYYFFFTAGKEPDSKALADKKKEPSPEVKTTTKDNSGETPAAAEPGWVQLVNGTERVQWGKFIDPDRDCKYTAENQQVGIHVPGTPHNLNPLPFWNNVCAPRIMQPVDGDFSLQVKVNQFARPQPNTETHAGKNAYTGAGLLVWLDGKTFIRWLRSDTAGSPQPLAHLEIFKDGDLVKLPAGTFHIKLPLAATYLRLDRRQGKFQYAASPDGRTWEYLNNPPDIALPSKLEVGVAAVNSTIKPFAPVFEGLQLENGWVQLFNGKDLDGWETFDKGPGRWKVVDSSITCDGPPSYLFTKRDDYKDFHFRIEARANPRGNSGQYFRCQFGPNYPKGYFAQINNSDAEFQDRTGSLVCRPLVGRTAPLATVTDALVLDDTWFTQEVIVRGNHIQILVNGKVVVNYTDNDKTFMQGRLALEHFTKRTRVEFRKVEIKELPPEEPGWVQLFNGKDLTGWETFVKGHGRWKVVDGNLTCDGPQSYLFSQRDDYRDFHFRVVARLNAKGNGGQYFRCRFAPNTPQGYFATINNSDPRFPNRTGSLMAHTDKDINLVLITTGLVDDNAWFTQEVIAHGNHIEVFLNGTKTADFVDKSNLFTQGRLALEHFTPETRVEFKKIEIK